MPGSRRRCPNARRFRIPAVLGEGSEIMAYPGRLEIRISSNPWFLYRTVWMNGTGPTPMPGQLFQHGFSRGHFDGNDLVIETDHFTFDPDGLDDHLHMASSVRKKITERYQLIDNDQSAGDHHARGPDVPDATVHLRVPVDEAAGRPERPCGSCAMPRRLAAKWNTRTRATSTMETAK